MRSLILLFICWCGIVNASSKATTCQQRHCLIVVDAGSTGSRLHLFAYDVDAHQHRININELESKKITPGFASIEPNQANIDDYLTRLFEGVSTQTIPVYFYATAGMRLIPTENQALYFQGLKNWFAANPYWSIKEARTITGREEGIFGWLAVNYQKGALDAFDRPLVGVMDVGGASVQITFPIPEDELANNSNVVNIVVNGRHITLFVHSFLGLGQTALSQQFLNAGSCFPTGYLLPNKVPAKGDAFDCQSDIARLINEVHGVSKIVEPVVKRNPLASWYAIGSVGYVVGDEPFSFKEKQFTNQRLLEQANNEVCQRPWGDLSAQYPDNGKLFSYCLFSSYYYALMVSGYGLEPEQIIHYMSAADATDWSLGVVLRPN